MKSIVAMLGLLAIGSTAVPSNAYAIGCLSGAAMGGVAGHVAGHHGFLGAAAGCAVGHHQANVNRRRAAEAAQQQNMQQNGTYQNGMSQNGMGQPTYQQQ